MTDAEQAADYIAKGWTCWACQARDIAAENRMEANRGKPSPGQYWSVAERVNGSH